MRWVLRSGNWCRTQTTTTLPCRPWQKFSRRRLGNPTTPWRISWTTPTEQYAVTTRHFLPSRSPHLYLVVRERGEAEDQEGPRHRNGVEKVSVPHSRPKGADTRGGDQRARRRGDGTVDVLDDNVCALRTEYRDLMHMRYNDAHHNPSSSSSSSPETSAFSCPALAMSWARSCSSLSEIALGFILTTRDPPKSSIAPWIDSIAFSSRSTAAN